MSEPRKKTKFWQIHLSTSVALMFAAGGLVWLNTIPNSNFAFGATGEVAKSGSNSMSLYFFGWPFHGCAYIDGGKFFFGDKSLDGWNVIYLNAVFDLLACLFLLLFLAFICEWLIRRREGRKL